MVEVFRAVLIGFGSLYIVLALVGYFLSDLMMFPMRANDYSIDGLVRLPIEDGGFVEALHLVNPDARYTLLYSHGNGEDLEMILPVLKEYSRRGYSVLAYEFPGYGRTVGTTSEKSVTAAIDAAYEYLTGQGGVAADRIVVYGRSMGSGPSTDLAARVPVAGLILEGGYVSIFRVITRLPILPWDKFANERKLPAVRCPVFVMQAEHDEVVGYWHGPRLYAAANEPKRFWKVDGAGHNSLMTLAGDEYWRRVGEFADNLAD